MLQKLRGSRVEEICSPPGVRGTLGAGDGLGGYPASQLVDLVTAGVHEADESTPPTFGTLSPNSRR